MFADPKAVSEGKEITWRDCGPRSGDFGDIFLFELRDVWDTAAQASFKMVKVGVNERRTTRATGATGATGAAGAAGM